MAKLYPPNIEGTIPAFYGTTIVVPFSMNRAVGSAEVKSFSLKVKKVNNTEIILTKNASRFDVTSNFKAFFDLSAEEQKLFNIGQFYRVQLAYIDITNTIGYYSTVGVIKYTAYPEVQILGLDKSITNSHLYEYIGSYKQTKDPTEKLYSSRLVLYDGEGQSVIDTGEILHSVLNDTVPNEALEHFSITQDLKFNTFYKIKYTATTVNGLVVSSPTYRIIQKENTNMQFDEVSNLRLSAINNYDKGSIELKFYSNEEIGVVTGNFIISRTEAIEPYEWLKIRDISLKAIPIDQAVIIDNTVEQGKTYIYSIQQYNNYGVYSSRLRSNEVMADFEDLFLLDKNKQLKIRFNPQVSSMRNNILESKVNTIGSKYPFITRNGTVNHKEFSLSGLISYQMDDNREFYTWKDLGLEENITDLVSENIKAEREFKLDVLDWLTSADAKILKSPTEGNYIVKLMGVSLSPNDTVGRMLHTFSCTASEIAPFEYDYLGKYGFINVERNSEDYMVSKWKTQSLYEKNEDGSFKFITGEILTQPIYSLKITDMMPGSRIDINGEPFYIGATQSYSTTVTSPIYSIVIPEGSQYMGSITYEYKGRLTTKFDNVRAINLQEVPARQFVGNSYWSDGYTNIMDVLKDVKTEAADILIAHFTKRGIHKIYTKKTDDIPSINNDFYLEGNNYNTKLDLNTLEKLSLYQIYYSEVGYNKKDVNGEIYYFNDEEEFSAYSGYYYDAANNKIIEDSFDLFDITINNSEVVNIEETEDLLIKDFDFLQLSIGDGVIAELTYFLQTMDYSYEFDNPEVRKLRQAYDKVLDGYLKYIVSPEIDENTPYTLENVKKAYKELIVVLEKVIEEDQLRGH